MDAQIHKKELSQEDEKLEKYLKKFSLMREQTILEVLAEDYKREWKNPMAFKGYVLGLTISLYILTRDDFYKDQGALRDRASVQARIDLVSKERMQ